MKQKIAILNLGYGNIASIINAVEYLGFKQKLENNPKNVKKYTHLILPGVGSFLENSKRVHKNDWGKEIIKAANNGIYIFGVCVGMQLMFRDGDEGGKVSKGLNLFSGSCKVFNNKKNIKLPHIGFNKVQHSNSKIWNGIPNNSSFYFVHSYRINSTENKYKCGYTTYGEKFISFIEHNNIFASQFHPEKSHKVGLKLLKNFLSLK